MLDSLYPSPGSENAVDGQNAEAHFHRGNRYAALRQLAAALASYDHAIAINPEFHEAHFNRGVVLKDLDQLEAALASYDRAIAIKPAFAVAHFNRGIVLHELEHLDAALASYEHAIRIETDHAGAYCNRGIVLEQQGQLQAALDSFNRAIEFNSTMNQAWFNRGNVLRKLRRFDQALASYDQAIGLDTAHAETHYNRGNLLRELQKFDLALASYNHAIEISGDYVEAYANRGNLFCDAKQYEAAIASYDDALLREPSFRFLSGQRRQAKMQICDWSGFEADVADLSARIERDEGATPPYHWLGLSGSASLQRRAAETWVREQFPPDPSLPPFESLAIPAAAAHRRIRIGYFSADFHAHPVSILAAEMFETHDRTRFEICAFAFGPANQDPMRKRLERAFDRFLDVRDRSDRQIALLARELQIDIAVDLSGFTQHCRPGIFALRAAPLQVSFLGYPGTLGAPYMDYLLADPTLIPQQSRVHYREQILYLPHSVMPHDSQQPIAESGLTRRQAGLPDSGFVFCAFNNVAKITPHTFARWMRILSAVPGSVLWLSATNPTAQSNLRREAASRGVDAARLIFAERLASLPEHLARHRLADLFLDTLPYNAHSTACDALWAGLPVLTLLGESFASRVAASLLTAIDLPELITSTPGQYEALAIELAANPEQLAHLRDRLARNRLTSPLFDTQRYTRHLEAAYMQIYTRHQAGLAAEHIAVLSAESEALYPDSTQRLRSGVTVSCVT
jgi:predicted O-linked N-acetylglucosamine transferase (SPINDLY family)